LVLAEEQTRQVPTLFSLQSPLLVAVAVVTMITSLVLLAVLVVEVWVIHPCLPMLVEQVLLTKVMQEDLELEVQTTVAVAVVVLVLLVVMLLQVATMVVLVVTE
jgi:hypothetical protein